MLQKSTPIELKHVFNKNDYATTSEWIRFNLQKKLNQQKHIQPTKKKVSFSKAFKLWKNLHPLKSIWNIIVWNIQDFHISQTFNL